MNKSQNLRRLNLRKAMLVKVPASASKSKEPKKIA